MPGAWKIRQSIVTYNQKETMANDPFRTAPVYPNKKKGPQGPIPARRG
jgi:hypothetical protein